MIVGVCVAQDAVKADSEHYGVVLENNAVRVLDIHYPPHAKGNMHSHPCSVTVFLTDGNLRMTMPDGKTRLGTVKAGQTVWENPGSHQPENLTDKTFHAIRTEFKNPEDCAKVQ
jgi:quercetin dioxygenase-like cupin family protein